jgi:hypothetical protein
MVRVFLLFGSQLARRVTELGGTMNADTGEKEGISWLCGHNLMHR